MLGTLWWETDFYTPPVLRGALHCQKGQHLPALEVYKISLPFVTTMTDQNQATQGDTCARFARCVPLCVGKICAARPGFARVVGEP